MIDPNFVLMYVDSPASSARFYSQLLGRQPIENSETFALFALESGVKLGFWSKHTVEPAALDRGDRGELAFALGGREQVDATFADWLNRGLGMLQLPTDMDFGYTFVAQDPDGHRLRVFTPA